MDEKLGETGDFPHGKLDKDDEGGLNMMISEYRGTVRFDFGKSIKWFALPPDMAVEFAENVLKHARRLRYGE
jgi:hypothetical protein